MTRIRRAGVTVRNRRGRLSPVLGRLERRVPFRHSVSLTGKTKFRSTTFNVLNATGFEARLSLDDLELINRVTNYDPDASTAIARLPTWQQTQINNYQIGIR